MGILLLVVVLVVLLELELELVVFLTSGWPGSISCRKEERTFVSWLSSEHRDNSSEEEEEEEEEEKEEEVSLWLVLLVGLGRVGRLDLRGDRRTLCGEGTSLLKEEGGMTPTPASSSRMFLARLALWPGLFLVVSEDILGRGMFSGAGNSWEEISPRLQHKEVD